MESENVFRGIEQTGERFKQEFAVLAEKAKRAIESKVNTAKLETVYRISVKKEERVKTMSEVKKVREELAGDALKKAKGDTKIATSFYEDACDFP